MVCLMSCEKSIKQKIAMNVEKKCSGFDSCIFNMKEITDFNWDKLYLFKEGTSLEDINKALGFNYPYFTDIANRIIFVKDHTIAYHEDEFIDPEAKPKSNVSFDIYNDTVPYYVFNLNNAIFHVRKKINNGNKYFVLTPIRHD